MRFNRQQTVIILLIAGLLMVFTAFQASWLADKPVGKPKLIADHAADPVRDAAGCVASANSGYGGAAVGPDIAALQVAAGIGADAIRVTTQMTNSALNVAPQFESACVADNARAPASIKDAVAGLTKPELFWQVQGALAAKQLVASLPTPSIDVTGQNILIGDAAAVAFIESLQPAHAAFSIAGARKCASDYHVSGMWGSVPESCKNGTMLLTLDDIGYSLWGWPNRFLARMKAANVRLIIAEDVVDGQIKGLTDVSQYGDIANSYNGYIWVDNIEELGPALRR
jgi:glycerophosphoryl diester phosphodiesterase